MVNSYLRITKTYSSSKILWICFVLQFPWESSASRITKRGEAGEYLQVGREKVKAALVSKNPQSCPGFPLFPYFFLWVYSFFFINLFVLTLVLNIFLIDVRKLRQRNNFMYFKERSLWNMLVGCWKGKWVNKTKIHIRVREFGNRILLIRV